MFFLGFIHTNLYVIDFQCIFKWTLCEYCVFIVDLFLIFTFKLFLGGFGAYQCYCFYLHFGDKVLDVG